MTKRQDLVAERVEYPQMSERRSAYQFIFHRARFNSQSSVVVKKNRSPQNKCIDKATALVLRLGLFCSCDVDSKSNVSPKRFKSAHADDAPVPGH